MDSILNALRKSQTNPNLVYNIAQTKDRVWIECTFTLGNVSNVSCMEYDENGEQTLKISKESFYKIYDIKSDKVKILDKDELSNEYFTKRHS